MARLGSSVVPFSMGNGVSAGVAREEAISLLE